MGWVPPWRRNAPQIADNGNKVYAEIINECLAAGFKAAENNIKTNYDLLFRMGDIYEKFGDTRSALKYLKEAEAQNPNSELADKIKRVELQDSVNKEYYSDTRIRG